MDERVVRIAELDIDPLRLADYLRYLREEIDAAMALEPDVIMLHAVSIKEAPHQVRLLEVYASQAAYEAHIRTPHFLRYKAGTSDMVRSLKLIDVEPVRLAAKVAG